MCKSGGFTIAGRDTNPDYEPQSHIFPIAGSIVYTQLDPKYQPDDKSYTYGYRDGYAKGYTDGYAKGYHYADTVVQWNRLTEDDLRPRHGFFATVMNALWGIKD